MRYNRQRRNEYFVVICWGRKIIVSICVIGLMLVSSGVSVNAFDKGELFMELETEGNTLITEYGDQRVIEINSTGTIKWIKTGLYYPVDAERLSRLPDVPDIDGRTSGKAGTSYSYDFVSTDPDGDQVYYWIEWGDNDKEEWIGPYDSGKKVTRRQWNKVQSWLQISICKKHI